ncbi:MAG TPA: hypothetical protein VGB53_02710 [Rubricoccaceae bacterium]|jgi:hypothetical protein
MRHLYALALAALLAGCRDDPPPPPAPVTVSAEPDSAGGGIPGPTSDEIDAGADILEDALKNAPSP